MVKVETYIMKDNILLYLIYALFSHISYKEVFRGQNVSTFLFLNQNKLLSLNGIIQGNTNSNTTNKTCYGGKITKIILTIKVPSKLAADDILNFYYYFSEKLRFDILCKSFAGQTIYIKCQALVSMKNNNKNFSKYCLLQL